MFLVAHPISQPSLDVSPIWIPAIEAEVRKLHLDHMGKLRLYVGIIQMPHLSTGFIFC
jgi:hypothetical protein